MATMDETDEGHQLWHGLDVRTGDEQIVKKRYSAFVHGSSRIESYLREHDLDTVLITGTATNVCCESRWWRRPDGDAAAASGATRHQANEPAYR
jgi:nicotinamidase-related amidase